MIAGNLKNRVAIKPNRVKYDQRHDVMHVFLSTGEPAFDDEDYPGIIIRRSMKNDKVIGITILDFSKRTKAELGRSLPKYDFSGVWSNCLN